MVGNKDADIAVDQVLHDFLYLDDGDRVDAGKGFVEKYKSGIGSKCAGDFHAPALTARQADT